MSERPSPEQSEVAPTVDLIKPPDSQILRPSNVLRLGRIAALQSGRLYAGKEPNQLQILEMLEPVVESELNRHNKMRTPWVPADFLPIGDDGKVVDRLEDRDPEAGPLLSPVAQAAMVTNLLTEDNLPAYHRLIANNFGLDSAWGTWVNQWTAEEDAHAYVMRSYLDLTKSVDPQQLEHDRTLQMIKGYNDDKDPLHTLAYVTFQELATRVSHRNTGIASNNVIADEMLARIAKDENMHMLFYRNLAAKALDLAPNQMMRAITDEVVGFEMPGANIAGFQSKALLIASSGVPNRKTGKETGIYDLRIHLKNVVQPVLKDWKIFERTDITGYGEAARQELSAFLELSDKKASKFEDQRDSGRLAATVKMLIERGR